MARPVSTIATGRVNRRFLALALILGLLFAVLTYITYSGSGGGDGAATSSRLSVVVAKDLIPAGTRITSEMVERRQIPRTAVGEGALTDLEGAVGQVAKFDIIASDPVLVSYLVDTSVPSNAALSYVVPEGQRGMGVAVGRVVNAGGLVLPGDHVDILWIPYKGAPAYILLENIEVTAVEQTLIDIAPAAPGVDTGEEEDADAAAAAEADASDSRNRNSDAETQPDASTVTMLLTSPETQVVLCAQHQAEKFDGAIRLAVRSFGDEALVGTNAPPCPNLPADEQQLAQQPGQ